MGLRSSQVPGHTSIPGEGMVVLPQTRDADRVTTPSAPSRFGTELQYWRRFRHLSQLNLAAAAQTTTRHLSFLETGRSRPSREMVERLGDALNLPLRARNHLLESAGFAAAYGETPLVAADLAPFRAVVERMLSQHAPFPAFVVDRHWNIVEANPAAHAFLAGSPERNVAKLTYAGPWRDLIDNWAVIAWAGVQRLHDDLQRHPDDPVLRGLMDLALGAVRNVPRTHDDAGGERVLCPHFRVGEQVVRTLGVVAQFGSPRDVTLDELRVELIYPADAAAEEFFRQAAAGLSAAASTARPATDRVVTSDGLAPFG